MTISEIEPIFASAVERQLSLYTPDMVQARKVGDLDLGLLRKKIMSLKGETVAALDIGGDKARVQLWRGGRGKLKMVEEIGKIQHKNGYGVLNFLEQQAQVLKQKGLTHIGISCAGITQGTRLKGSPNCEQLVSDMGKHGGDFAKIFSGQVSVDNDAVAGLKAAVGAVDQSNVLFLIAGGGFGGAVYRHGEYFTAEPGHVPLYQDLNYRNDQRVCQLNPQCHGSCVEMAIGVSMGIEYWYNQIAKPKKYMTGPAISQALKQGDLVAAQVYLHSAQQMAIGCVGMAKVFGLLREKDLAVVFHGGLFHVDLFRNRTLGFIDHYFGVNRRLGFNPKTVFVGDTKIFPTDNASIMGAAVAAFCLE